MDSKDLCCIPKSLPAHLHIDAAKIAVDHNPANAPRLAGTLALGVMLPEHIALLTTKYWGAKGVSLGVKFLDTTNTALKAKILSHMNAWNKWSNVKFVESSSGQVRITLQGDGYWSYLGTDILSIPSNQPTMSLQDFSLSTPDSEYARVVRHETGHTLGFPHEHQRAEVIALLDKAKTIAWFAANVGWDATTVQEQIFDALDPATLQATAADVVSIMCYQFAGACTVSGQPIPGGLDIDPTDGTFAGKIYPLSVTPPIVNPGGGGAATISNLALSLAFGGWSNGEKIGSVAQLSGTAKVTATASGDVPTESVPAPSHSFAVLALLAKYGPLLYPLIEEYGPKVIELIVGYLKNGLSGTAILGQLHVDLGK